MDNLDITDEQLKRLIYRYDIIRGLKPATTWDEIIQGLENQAKILKDYTRKNR